MTRSKEEILPELEAKLLEYITAGTELGDHVMLDGFVLKARAIDMEREGPQTMGVTIWLTPTHQDVFKSLGMAEALVQDVSRYYDSLYNDADRLDED